MVFQPGQSGNPAGRPKGAKQIKLLMADVLSDAEFDWAKDFADAVETNDEKRLEMYKSFAPYLFAVPRVKEVELKSDSPERSKERVDEAIGELKAIADANRVNGRTEKEHVAMGIPVAQVPTNTARL